MNDVRGVRSLSRIDAARAALDLIGLWHRLAGLDAELDALMDSATAEADRGDLPDLGLLLQG